MARNVLVETGGVRYHTPGRSNLVAVKEGEDVKSYETSSSGSEGELELTVNWCNGLGLRRR